MDLVFSTSEVDRAERLSCLRELLSERFLDLDVTPLGRGGRERDFHGSVSTRDLAGLRVTRFSGSPIAATRTSRHIDSSAGDDYLVGLTTRGIASASQGGRDVILRPGDLALFDSARPYAIELMGSGAFEHIVYQVPRSRLDARGGQLERSIAVGVSACSDGGRLASPYLRTLASPTWSKPPGAAAPLIEIGLDLLVSACLDAAGLDAPPASRQAEMLQALKRYTLSHLGDSDLSPRRVAAAHYVSVRHLHRLFALGGMSFGAWVREERLRRCRADLADPRLRGLSIAVIAARWGYSDAPNFSRAFSGRYGVAPRDFRQQLSVNA